jgi:hypothetical protein
MDQAPDQTIAILQLELGAGENIPHWLFRRRMEKKAQRRAERQAQRNFHRAAEARGAPRFGPSTVVNLDSRRRRR